MHDFHYRQGRLFCEGADVESLALRHGTPLYVYSRRTIENHFTRLDRALAPLDHTICYAVKANSNLAILTTLARLKAGFDIVSGGELYRVVRAGGDPARCVFAGVGKTEEEIRYALRVGIHCFNVESASELDRIHRTAVAMRKKAPIALRVNPDVEAHTHAKITTGTYENKFGIAYEEITGMYERATRLPALWLRGVQMHIGSQITTVAPFVKAVRKMLPLARALRDRHGIEFFSIGGGIGIVYRPALESGNHRWWNATGAIRPCAAGRAALPLTIDLYARALIPLLKPLGMRILLEPGRFIVGNAGILVTRVEFLKQTGRKHFVIVDAAMNDLVRPAFYDSYHQIVPVRRNHRAQITNRKSDVVGPICESGDYFAKDRPLESVREGDFLALMSAGAYGFAMASNYNTRPRPAEILVSGKSARMVRRRETPADLVRGETR
ncbi:MAG: diaminopimelate decarboxylase [Verrucomicrobia bacterium]|nr:diaminopimelate decarboxylase [Verrucomicrobiota bacterium]